MIGKLTGIVEARASDHILLDVRGVGYVVHCSDRTRAALPNGELVAVYTEMIVREDLMQLIGFLTMAEREWFRLLISVQGIGAKAALAILGTLGADGTGRAIALGDWTAIKAAPGVGPKIAQRVTNELRDKAPDIMAMAAGGATPSVVDTGDTGPVPVAAAPQDSSAQADALSALANLGYNPSEAASAVAQAAGDAPDAGTEDLLRTALRLLAPKD